MVNSTLYRQNIKYEREFGITQVPTSGPQRDIDYQAIRPGRLIFNRCCLLPDDKLPV